MSLDELLQIRVVTNSQKEEELFVVPAAITVITASDISNYGAITLPEVLRYVPGLHVAQQNAHTWAIGARGFNSQYANKQQVMIDGRSAYDPLFSGVFWDMQSVFLPDIDRVEVIRGPGSSIWGANAVNGIINVISKDAFETQGGLLVAGGGNMNPYHIGVRMGEMLGENTAWRFNAMSTGFAANDQADGNDASDAWQLKKAGVRVDNELSEDHTLSFSSEYVFGEIDATGQESENFYAMANWKFEDNNSNYSEIRWSYDMLEKEHLIHQHTENSRIDFQHLKEVGEIHQINTGLGGHWANAKYALTSNPRALSIPSDIQKYTYHAYLQDKITLADERVELLAGLKWEQDKYAGDTWQPTLRLSYLADETQTFWLSATRTVRTPSFVEFTPDFSFITSLPQFWEEPEPGIYVDLLHGNPSVKSETMWAYEFGYRTKFNNSCFFDLALYYQDYNKLINDEKTGFAEPGFPFGFQQAVFINSMNSYQYGLEASLLYKPTTDLSLTFNYTLREISSTSTHPLSTDFYIRKSEEFPQQLISLLCNWKPASNWESNTQLRFVGYDFRSESYWELDLNLGYEINANWKIRINGKNLLHENHIETSSAIGGEIVAISRSVFLESSWCF